MVKAQKRNRDREVKKAAFKIIEQAQESKQVKESLGEQPLFFEDKLPQKDIKAPRVLKVDEILKPKSLVKSVPQPAVKKSSAEATLVKRYAKSVNVQKPKKGLSDPWDDGKSGEKMPMAKIESVVPQAMSYRPDPSDQMRILQAIEKREQEKMNRMEKYKEEAEVIKKALTTPDMASPYLLPFSNNEHEVKESFETNINNGGSQELKKSKTKKERAQALKETEERMSAAKRKEEKKLEKQFDQIEAIAKQVKKEINASKKKQTNKKALTMIDADQVILPEQVPSSLRDISTAGNLVSDVYKSLKKRVAIGERKKRTNTLPLRTYTLHCHK